MEFHGKACYHLSPKGTGFPFQEKERSCAQYGDISLSEVQKELCAEAISLIKGALTLKKRRLSIRIAARQAGAKAACVRSDAAPEKLRNGAQRQ